MVTENQRPWLTSNLNTAYPFNNGNQTDLLEAGDLRALFVDARFYYPGEFPDGKTPLLELVNFTKTGDTLSQCPFEFEVRENGSGDLFMDTRTDHISRKCTEFGDFAVLQFTWLAEQDASSSSSGEGFSEGFGHVMRFVIHVPSLAAFTWPQEPDPRPQFLATCVEARGGLVESLTFRNDGLGTLMRAGPIYLRAGYNTRIDVEREGASAIAGLVSSSSPRRRWKLTVNAIPGAGEGRVDNCDEDAFSVPITEINGIGPNGDGNYTLISKDPCYWVTRPHDPGYADLSVGVLNLRNDCGVCCSCDDYVRVYQMLARVYGRLLAMQERLPGMLSRYSCQVAAMEARALCEPGVNGYLHLYPKPGFTVGVQFMVVNSTTENLEVISSLEFTLTTDATLAYVIDSGSMYTQSDKREAYDFNQHDPIGIPTLARTLHSGTAMIFEFELYALRDGNGPPGTEVQCAVTGSFGGNPVSDSKTCELLAHIDLADTGA